MNTTIKTLTPLAGLALATGSAHAALVAHYEFDNNANVGEATVGTDLVASGDAAYTASGVSGGALSLDGVSDFLQVDGSQSLPVGVPTGDSSYTIATFIQTTNSTGNNGRNTIVTWGNGANSQINAFRTSTAGEAGNVENNGTSGILNYNWGGASRGDLGAGSGANIFDGNWHHVAVTYDSATSTKRLYYNGVQISSDFVVTNNMNVQGVNFRLGSNRNDSEEFNGLLDDVRIYDNALSGSEVAALVPEPGSLALLGLGGLFVLQRRRNA